MHEFNTLDNPIPKAIIKVNLDGDVFGTIEFVESRKDAIKTRKVIIEELKTEEDFINKDDEYAMKPNEIANNEQKSSGADKGPATNQDLIDDLQK